MAKTGVSLLWAGYIDQLAYNGLDFDALPNLSANAVWALQTAQKVFGSVPPVLCPFA
jgi:hypothetical protein|tara:strand:+ start:351 stop:521 length:171 start_codon:yes stop_codon:yes gene_type:complete